MNSTFWSLLTGAVIIAIIYSLVRPNSAGPRLVHDVSEAFASLIKTSTGFTGEVTAPQTG